MNEGYDPYNHTPAWMIPGVIVRADQWTPEELERALKRNPMVIQITNAALRRIGNLLPDTHP